MLIRMLRNDYYVDNGRTVMLWAGNEYDIENADAKMFESIGAAYIVGGKIVQTKAVAPKEVKNAKDKNNSRKRRAKRNNSTSRRARGTRGR